MNRFWDSVIRPIIEKIGAKYIIEIGSDKGINTRNILEYCKDHDARMTAIDPAPLFDVKELKSKYDDKFEFFQELSLSRLPLLKDYDVVLIDGDHNWYTVYNELKIIEKSFKGNDFPIVFLHDVGWPYGRRDLYYNPENIPQNFKQPYKQLGMYPGHSNLKEKGGLNPELCNSLYENNLKNGVLTAVEDVINESDIEFSFFKVDAFYGLGILFLKNNELEEIVKNHLKSGNLINDLEETRIKLTIANNELKNMNGVLESKISEMGVKLRNSEDRVNSLEKEKYKELNSKVYELTSSIYESKIIFKSKNYIKNIFR
ncbi:MAG: hypothetical protein PWQ15_1794 [Methanobacterium sp.]|uniref:class I SAM-dependent methyltransferase n=1 Tax=Methanobacterium sp. TaxID=2164 RepID=UPI0024AB5FF1|nr:class I SAM-dependent methyltransferase [Methanobacterium sp.]MDI3550691.1 hypothetical protein [Methanobacterium sp.]